MKRRQTYNVQYKLWGVSEIRSVDVIASSKAEAYDVAVYERIPEKEQGEFPYSAWVNSVTSQNGNWTHFNTFEGNPY